MKTQASLQTTRTERLATLTRAWTREISWPARSWLVAVSAAIAVALTLLWMPSLAHAQVPVLVDHDPVTNAVAAALDSSVVLTFHVTNTAGGAATITNTAGFSGTAQAGSAQAVYTATSTCVAYTGNWTVVFAGCPADAKRVIPSGVTVTLDDNVDLQADLELEAGGTLDATSQRRTVTLTGDQPQTLAGTPLTFYNLVVNKIVNDPMLVVTIDGKLKVTKKLTVRSGKLVSASDYEDIEIEHDGELQLTNDITVSGSFTNSGALAVSDYGITFDGAKTQNLYVDDHLSLVDLTVYTGTVLVEANPNGTIVLDGALINYGVIRETQPVNAAGAYYFGLVGTYSDSSGMVIDVTDRSGGDPLTAIQVDRIDANHPNAPGSATTDIYWTITPSGTDYVATVVLPQNALADPLACRHSGGAWDCGRASFDSDIDLTVTRAGVTAFSDWAVFETQATTTTLATSASPVTQRAVITFTATVDPAAAPGSVEFFADGASLGTITVTAGNALLPTTDLSVGTHTITATYSGGAHFTASTAAAITQVVNSGVTAVNDAAGTLQATPVTIGVLANDHDPAGLGLTVITVTNGTHGGVAIVPGGQAVIYTPAADFSGVDNFTYTAVDGYGATDDALVAVVVTPRSQTDSPTQVAAADPAISHTVAFSSTQTDVALDLPAGFYTGTVESKDIFFLAFTPVVTPTHPTPPSGLKFGDIDFELDAFLNDTSLGGITFAEPVALTLTYSPTQFSGVILNTLALYAWAEEGGAWSEDGITCSPPDTGNHTVTCGIAHLAEFGVLGDAIPIALVDHAPVTNTVAAPLDSSIVLTYSASIDASTVTSRTVAIYSMMQGLVPGVHSVAGSVVTVNPPRAFFPGELVYTSATTQTTDLTGTHPLTPTVWQFNAAAPQGHGRFADTPLNVGIGSDWTCSLAWGDYDNDGDLDLAVGNLGGQNAVYPNNGDGSFGSGVNFGAGSDNTNSLAWGDFDADGDLDLAVGNYMQQSAVYLNNGDGSFGAAVNFGAGSDTTNSLAWGDYDADGDLDLAVGNNGGQNAVYPNNGDGSFGAAVNFGTGSDWTYSLAWGDFDADGDLDLAMGNYMQPNAVYPNNGDGSFGAAVSFGPGSDATIGLAWGDFDADGDLDLAVGNYGEQNKVYLNEAPPPDVSIIKTVSPVSDVAYQGLVTYTLILSNTGGLSAPNVFVTDTLPAGTTFADWIEQSGAAHNAGAVTWNGVVSASGSVTVSFAVTNTACGGATITNTASFSGTAQAGSATATYSTTSTLTPSGSGNWSDVFPPCTGVCHYVIPAGVAITLTQDIELAGNLSVEAGAAFVPNGQTVTLTGDQPQTLTGTPLTFYNLVVNKTNKTDTVTIDGKLTVTKKLTVRSGKLISASDYEDIEIEDEGELQLTNDITVSGSFTNSGMLDTNGYSIAFDGAREQNLTLDGLTSFDAITVYTGTTLIETVSGDHATVTTLTNHGVIRKTQDIADPDTYDFGLAGEYHGGALALNVTTDNFDRILVARRDQDHANRTGTAAGSGVGWGIYWTITPTGSGTADVTLPHALADHTQAKACRYTGAGTSWDCARDSSDATTVTRLGVTSFSDWAVGRNVGPNAVTMRALAARPDVWAALRALLAGLQAR